MPEQFELNNAELIYSGSITVDSGLLSISDPCYWDDERLAYDNIIKIVENDTEEDDPIIELGQLEHVGASMALAFPTVTGDGIYSVYSVWQDNEIKGMFVSFENELMGGADE
jgi:hypothetical protein